MKVKNISITEIKPYKKNAKKHPMEQVKHIANSIKEFGWQQPIVIDKNGEIVIGHGRYQAALYLGLDEVPVLRADDLSEEQIKALRLADNKTNESEWDDELLSDELNDILEIDMSNFGFEVFEEPIDLDGGEIEDNENKQVAIKITFPNAQKMRSWENKIREFVDKIEDANISVGAYDENN